MTDDKLAQAKSIDILNTRGLSAKRDYVRRLDELASRDRALYERLERMMRNEELMNVEDGQVLSDDHDLVRSSEEGVEWELLTGPSPETDRPGPSGGGNAERKT